MFFQRVDGMSKELETSQAAEGELIYKQFIQVYLSRQDLPGKNVKSNIFNSEIKEIHLRSKKKTKKTFKK